MKLALLFPGQGSQYVSMGRELYQEGYKSFFDQADEILNFSLSKLCFEGPNEELKLTPNTQPAIVAHSMTVFEKLKQALGKKLNFDIVAGHSVGEYSALIAAGVLSFKDGIHAVRKRGMAMQDAVPVGQGKMYAILKLSEDIVEQACQEIQGQGYKVMPANYNEPKQIVISGESQGCDLVVEWLKKNIDQRHGAIELPVSAPFHSDLMMPAQKKMEGFLSKINFNSLKINYIANIDANIYFPETKTEKIKSNLIQQISGPVRWTQTLQKLNNYTHFLEVGPGKVLSGLVKKTLPDAKVMALDTLESFEKLYDFTNEDQ